MKITADTNVLVRGVVRDNESQAHIVDKVLNEATLIAVSLPCLCEFIWVLRRGLQLGAITSQAFRPGYDAPTALKGGVLNQQGIWIKDHFVIGAYSGLSKNMLDFVLAKLEAFFGVNI